MKKIIYTLIAAFVACTAVAQTPSAYFMEGSTFRSQLNPAFAPLRGYVNIPVLGGVQVNVSGNLSVSDIFYPVNGSLVTLFDKNVSAAEALGNLRSKNMLGTDARINIVGFGAFRKDHKTFWSFDLNVRMEAEANMPYSLFDFLKNGRNEAVSRFINHDPTLIHENANKDSNVYSTQRDLLAGAVSLKRSASPRSTLPYMSASSAMTGETYSMVSLTALLPPSPLMR